ncbi:uncharacterized protein LOC119373578 [Rhipicephalus sanguineus]|uniref:uncharacterized protein LOC119373578 n=1 Tax=Rhipicephalus sanguineus TaxID=34632 RepID=UPI0020C59634|nr:uncharacterized protein LOC119373578 [Rhipicephalus sanguineus]
MNEKALLFAGGRAAVCGRRAGVVPAALPHPLPGRRRRGRCTGGVSAGPESGPAAGPGGRGERFGPPRVRDTQAQAQGPPLARTQQPREGALRGATGGFRRRRKQAADDAPAAWPRSIPADFCCPRHVRPAPEVSEVDALRWRTPDTHSSRSVLPDIVVRRQAGLDGTVSLLRATETPRHCIYNQR